MKTLSKAIISFVAFFAAHSMAHLPNVYIIPSFLVNIVGVGFSETFHMHWMYKLYIGAWFMFIIVGVVFAIIAAIESFQKDSDK